MGDLAKHGCVQRLPQINNVSTETEQTWRISNLAAHFDSAPIFEPTTDRAVVELTIAAAGAFGKIARYVKNVGTLRIQYRPQRKTLRLPWDVWRSF